MPAPSLDHLAFLRDQLSQPRLRHSLDVMQVMGELAEVYGLDRDRAMTAGLLHDAAKDLDPARQRGLIREAKVELAHPSEMDPIYLHGIAGACLVCRELDISDPLILEAIATHSTHGQTAAPTFSWALRFADLLSPIKPWHGMNKLRHLVYAGRMHEAALLQTGWLIDFFREQNWPVHPNLPRNLDALSAGLQVEPGFFERW